MTKSWKVVLVRKEIFAGVVGGMGNGLRVFPPAGGLSVVVWFCVDAWATVESVRLLDITRHLHGKSQENLTCLSVHLLADPGHTGASSGAGPVKLLVSTREHASMENPEVEPSGDTVLLDLSVLREQDGVWHCLVVSLVSVTIILARCCPILSVNTARHVVASFVADAFFNITENIQDCFFLVFW